MHVVEHAYIYVLMCVLVGFLILYIYISTFMRYYFSYTLAKKTFEFQSNNLI